MGDVIPFKKKKVAENLAAELAPTALKEDSALLRVLAKGGARGGEILKHLGKSGLILGTLGLVNKGLHDRILK